MAEFNEEEIDRCEEIIPQVAAAATHAAYLRAIAAGHTLEMEKNGMLVRVGPDGSETPLRAVRAKHKVEVGKAFSVRRLFNS